MFRYKKELTYFVSLGLCGFVLYKTLRQGKYGKNTDCKTSNLKCLIQNSM